MTCSKEEKLVLNWIGNWGESLFIRFIPLVNQDINKFTNVTFVSRCVPAGGSDITRWEHAVREPGTEGLCGETEVQTDLRPQSATSSKAGLQRTSEKERRLIWGVRALHRLLRAASHPGALRAKGLSWNKGGETWKSGNRVFTEVRRQISIRRWGPTLRRLRSSTWL